ncbi:hypothetical protein UFOVP785_75 [uncultured Caudovirales phage]|uniref:Uncharacterized protein n=1 Tax=uncultured Caudovirales phage TaxID=2100421 RepID=A0A6J5NY60_9CAUD|nr:hypothetical protein UFOVP785_75 [uncultured Caudovirales phage]
MLPVDLLVELLMENLPNNWMWTLDGKSVSGSSRDELEKEVRTYLESLVPDPKLLSECEEGVRYECDGGEVLYRRGESAINMHGYHHEFADKIQVIQPVEANRE